MGSEGKTYCESVPYKVFGNRKNSRDVVTNQVFDNVELIEKKCIKIFLRENYVQPLFTGIKYGSPASEDYMMIEPLTEYSKSSQCRIMKSENVTERNAIDAHVIVDAQSKIVCNSGASSMNNNNAIDVTVLPENLSSYSHCLHFTSARMNRLRLLRDAAVWRAVGLFCGWLLVTLFFWWLSSKLSLSSIFAINPLKYYLREKKEKNKKEKTVLTSCCYDKLYEFSKWDKFITGRPKTSIFFQGKTYTYEKLPSFPKLEKNSKTNSKTGRKKKLSSTVNSKNSVNSICTVVKSVINSLVDNVVAASVDILPNNFVVPVPVPVVMGNSTLNPSASLFVSNTDSKCVSTHLRDLRIENMGNIIIAHLNINSLRYKFDFLVEMISDNIDILVIGETKLNSSFPKGQFKINGFNKPYRLDRNEDGGGVMVYVREDIPSQENPKKYQLPANIEGNSRNQLAKNQISSHWYLPFHS